MILLEVNLPDVPGSLIELIKPISKNGGNIYGILHDHDRKIDNLVPVHVSFELKNENFDDSLKQIKNQLEQKKIEIINISMDSQQKTYTFLLYGHVFDTDITDTINKLNAREIKILDLKAKFTEFKEVSNVMLRVEFPKNMSKANLIGEIENICKKKDLFMIKS